MAGRLTAPGAVISSDSIVEVMLPLGAAGAQSWCEIPGASGIDLDNGERPINETPTFRGTITQTGEKTKPTITIELASVMPASRVAKGIVKKFEDDDYLDIRWYFPGRTVIPQTVGANNTIDITTGGVVTFGSAVSDAQKAALASDRVPEGFSLFTGAQGSYVDYMIESKTIDANGLIDTMSVVDAATDAPPAAQVSDAFFGVRNPEHEQPSILCNIMSAGNLTAAESQAGASSQLVLRAVHNIAPYNIISN